MVTDPIERNYTPPKSKHTQNATLILISLLNIISHFILILARIQCLSHDIANIFGQNYRKLP